MSVLANFEGPPSPSAMENVFGQLVVRGEFARALSLATIMRDWWLNQPILDYTHDYDRSASFYRWLGAASAISDVIWALDRAKSDRAFKRASRVARRGRR